MPALVHVVPLENIIFWGGGVVHHTSLRIPRGIAANANRKNSRIAYSIGRSSLTAEQLRH